MRNLTRGELIAAAGLVATIVGAIWKFSGDISSLRSEMGTRPEARNRELDKDSVSQQRIDGYQDRQIDSLDRRVSGLESTKVR